MAQAPANADARVRVPGRPALPVWDADDRHVLNVVEHVAAVITPDAPPASGVPTPTARPAMRRTSYTLRRWGLPIWTRLTGGHAVVHAPTQAAHAGTMRPWDGPRRNTFRAVPQAWDAGTELRGDE